MNELAGLLRAIVEAPHDPAPRLIFADWLEEQGQGERAEWVVLQERMGEVPPHYGDGFFRKGLQTDPDDVALCNCPWCRLQERLQKITALTVAPLPLSPDCPRLADVLRAWCGAWPHADDSLRELVAWWLGAVEWDHARAADVQQWEIVLTGSGFPDRVYLRRNTSRGAPYPFMYDVTHDSNVAAVRDLKRRVLALFPEVEWTAEYRNKSANIRQSINLRDYGFRADVRCDVELPTDANGGSVTYRQTLAAPDWIAPEPPDDLVVTSLGMTDVRGALP